MDSTMNTGKAPLIPQTRIDRGKDAVTPRRSAETVVARWWRAYCRWDDRLRQRRHLGALDDHMLEDIGVTAKQARQEASRWLMV
jgi:uncharacterized protein YjiS (DUF1127 family)